MSVAQKPRISPTSSTEVTDKQFTVLCSEKQARVRQNVISFKNITSNWFQNVISKCHLKILPLTGFKMSFKNITSNWFQNVI
jgi:hypothetical protein